jgi:hypothetical protein
MSDDRLFMPEYYNLLTNKIRDEYVDDIFETNTDMEFLEFISNFVKNKKVTHINAELELFMKIMGHNKDNIKSIYVKGNRGIGKNGIIKVYTMYKETYPDPIDFNSESFKERVIDHIKLYKKLKDGSMDDGLNERLKVNLKIVKFDEESMPKELYKKMKDVVKL